MTMTADVTRFVVLIDQLSAEHAELLPCTDKLSVACIPERRRDR
jgi:hypothetical protein